jgi:hypothetical protein
MSKPNIVEAMSDRRLFEPWFRGRSWDGWKAMLKAAHGIPMQPEEIKLLHKLADRDPPKRQVREFWVCGGRRLGKDSIASLSVGHSAAFFDGGKKLRRGERARFLSLACSRDQSRIALEYTRSYYTEIKPLAGQRVVRLARTKDSTRASRNIMKTRACVIEILSCILETRAPSLKSVSY